MVIFKVQSSKDVAFEGEYIFKKKYFILKEDAQTCFFNMIQDLIKDCELDMNKLKKVCDDKECWWYKDALVDIPDEYSVVITPIDVE